MRIVLDASVLVLAALDPATDPRAELFQILFVPLVEHAPLHAPALLAFEVANVVHYKRPQDFGVDQRARTRVVALLLQHVHLDAPDPSTWRAIATLVEEHGLTAYDAAYLALATRGDDAHLVTEDQRLLAAARAVLGERAIDLQGLYEAMEAGRV